MFFMSREYFNISQQTRWVSGSNISKIFIGYVQFTSLSRHVVVSFVDNELQCTYYLRLAKWLKMDKMSEILENIWNAYFSTKFTQDYSKWYKNAKKTHKNILKCHLEFVLRYFGYFLSKSIFYLEWPFFWLGLAPPSWLRNT